MRTVIVHKGCTPGPTQILPVYDMNLSLTAEEVWLRRQFLEPGFGRMPRGSARKAARRMAQRRWTEGPDGIRHFK